jgi:hypothetical protein
MKVIYPNLEILARELQTIQEGKGKNINSIIDHCRDDSYPRHSLVYELKMGNLGFFAQKLESGYYDKLPDPVE